MANSSNGRVDANYRDSSAVKFVSRRGVLHTLGAGSIAALAGCSGDDPEEGDDTNPDVEAAQPEERTFTRWRDSNPARESWNKYDPDGGAILLSHYYAVENHTGQHHMESLVDDWWFESPTEPRIQLADEDFVWHDGDPVTIEDVHAQMVVNYYQGERPQGDIVEGSQEIIDDRTVGLETEFPMHEESFWTPFFAYDYQVVKHDHPFWQDIRERLEDATTDEEIQETVTELRDHSFDDPVGCGPWELDQATGSRAIYTLNQDHPWADEFAYHTLESIYIPGRSGVYERMLTENIDQGYGRMPSTVLDQMPDAYELYNNHWWWGMGLAMHQDMFPNLHARKAMMYALDHETICANSGVPDDVLEPKPFQSGIIGDEERHQEIVGDLVDDYEDYEQDQDRAAELLEEAGFTREGDQWLRPNGDPFEFQIIAPTTFDYYTPMVETAQTQLAEMGIQTELVVQESGPYYGETYVGGNFDMVAAIAHGGHWDPVVSLNYNHAPELIGALQRDNGMSLESIEVPMPIGDPNGDLEEVDFYEYSDKLALADDEERLEGRRMLSWICNQHPAYYEQSQHFNVLGLHENWVGPDEDEEWAGLQSDYEWHQHGVLEANE